MTETTLKCDLSCFGADERARLVALAEELFGAATELRELPDGFAVGFANASREFMVKLAEFVTYDRRCCSFIRHAVVVEPHETTTWLQVTGGEGVKDAMRQDLLRLVFKGLQAPK
jgi:hypothetical protein